MIDQLVTGMDEAHQAVSPSHVNIILRDFVDQETVDRLKNVPGVLDIDPVNQLSVRYKIDPGAAWELGTLVMRPDYSQQRLDLLEFVSGEWPGAGETTVSSLGIERLSGQYFGLELVARSGIRLSSRRNLAGRPISSPMRPA
jgi:putative ABC transport system permease protein